MGLEVTRTPVPSAWRAFVADRGGTVFHTPEMQQVFARARGHRPVTWAAVRDGELQALLPVVEVGVGPRATRRLARRAIAYGGVLAAPGPEGAEALDAVLATHERHVGDGVLLTELRHQADPGPVAAVLAARGYAHEPHLDYLIDLDRPVDDILQSMGRSTRKQVRRGLRQGRVTVEDAATPTDVAACHDLLHRTYRRTGVPLADASLFRAAFDVLVPRGMARFVMARLDGALVATSVELAAGARVDGWYSGVDRAAGRWTPNELLMWDVLRRGAEEGRRVYAFGGAGHPDEEYGVRDFKAKFGGRLVDPGRGVRVHARVRLRLARAGYDVYRRVVAAAPS